MHDSSIYGKPLRGGGTAGGSKKCGRGKIESLGLKKGLTSSEIIVNPVWWLRHSS